MLFGPEILTRTLSAGAPIGPPPNIWQYHPRSDRHSAVACWGIVFDLLASNESFRSRVANGELGYATRHKMRDAVSGITHPLPVVLGFGSPSENSVDFATMGKVLNVQLTKPERALLDGFPPLPGLQIRSVVFAATSRASMTSIAGSTTRLFDSMDATRTAALGDCPSTILVGHLLCNAAVECFSPLENRVVHNSRKGIRQIVQTGRRLAVHTARSKPAFSSFGISFVDCRNDTNVKIRSVPNEVFEASDMSYTQMISEASDALTERLSGQKIVSFGDNAKRRTPA
jgi:hypothetical protein